MSSFCNCKKVDWTERKLIKFEVFSVHVWNLLRTAVNFHIFLFLEQLNTVS